MESQNPADTELIALAAGKLSADTARPLEQHLKQCQSCRARIDALTLKADSSLVRLPGLPLLDNNVHFAAADPMNAEDGALVPSRRMKDSAPYDVTTDQH